MLRGIMVLQSTLPIIGCVLLCQVCFGITILNHECRGLPVNSQVWILLFETDQQSYCVGSRCCSLLSHSMVVSCCVKSALVTFGITSEKRRSERRCSCAIGTHHFARRSERCCSCEIGTCHLARRSERRCWCAV